MVRAALGEVEGAVGARRRFVEGFPEAIAFGLLAPGCPQALGIEMQILTSDHT